MWAGITEELLLLPKARGAWGKFAGVSIRERGSEISKGFIRLFHKEINKH